jgi:hypothetical protein
MIFEDKRVRMNREFFYVNPEKARLAIKLAEVSRDKSDVTPINDLFDDVSRVAISNFARISESRTRLRHENLGIPIGSTLTFSEDDNVTCTTVENGKVCFDGNNMSLYASALLVKNSRGFNWTSVQGGNYWKYNGETLVEMRDRLEMESLPK